MAAERRRPRPGVDHDVVDRTAGAADELRLAPPGPGVEAAQRAEAERDCESCTNAAGSMPCTAATSASNVRVKKPRWSRWGVGANTSTPASDVVRTCIPPSWQARCEVRAIP